MKGFAITSSDWLTKGIAPEKLESEKALALISAKIYLRRKELGLDQKGFAKVMGVSQAMVSKWESGNCNFTIETLISICFKLNLSFEPTINSKADPSGETIAYSETSMQPVEEPDAYIVWVPSHPVHTGGAV